VEARRSTQISTQTLGLTMAYTERRERQKGIRYRGIYKAADGRYRSAGTFITEERALEVAKEPERRAAEVIRGAAGGLDPRIRATRTIKEYAPLPTAYQVRHTHASWLIDAGENPKAVMHRLGQANLRATARYVLDETGESAARRFPGTPGARRGSATSTRWRPMRLARARCRACLLVPRARHRPRS
jgi:integrase